MKSLNEALSKDQLEKREEYLKQLKKQKSQLVKRYGKDAEAVIYGRATNMAKKAVDTMKKQNLKELVRQALTNEQDVEVRADKIDGQETLNKASNLLDSLELALKNHDWYYEMSDDPRIYDKGQSQMSNIKSMIKQLNSMGYGDDANSLFNQYKQQKPYISEDLDLGHEDNEPHHIKSELYKIGKYAMELYQIMDELEGQGEIDLPAWWQSKITKACSMIGSAKHYLEFELKEPEIDAMVDVAQAEDVLSELVDKITKRLKNND